MKALMSPLARRILLAGIRPRPGIPFTFEGKTYVPILVPAAGKGGE